MAYQAKPEAQPDFGHSKSPGETLAANTQGFNRPALPSLFETFLASLFALVKQPTPGIVNGPTSLSARNGVGVTTD